MSNWKKKKGNIGRNKQRRYNRRTGRVENFNARHQTQAPSPAKVQTNNDNHLTPEEARQAARKHHSAKGFVPETRVRTFRHCTCQGTELALKNQRLLELLRKEPRGFDPVTGVANVLVITQRFRGIHARHMKHFVAFLREQNIRYR
jgi:hypothetical protein